MIARGRDVARAPAQRFCRPVQWRPADGWEPLCVPLEAPVPGEPFPRTNGAAGFRTPARLAEPA